MADKALLILIDNDNPAARALSKVLGAGFPTVRSNDAGIGQADLEAVKVAVVCLTNSALTRYSVANASLGLSAANTVFVLPTHNPESIKWLDQHGVYEYFVAPVADAVLWGAVQHALNRGVESSWEDYTPIMRDALVSSRKSLSDCFDQARTGRPLDLIDVNRTCGLIGSAVENVDFSDWLSSIRQHHDYTYRHSMFVCGTLTHFAREAGVRGNDLHALTVGGMLHDVGKSRVPQAILDKPAKLDDSEWAVMREHPSHSRDILFQESELDPDIVAMAVHHHEKLDGTGYPDGLSGAQITDHIRLMAIADVFSALVDERAYKPPMSPEAALNRMLEFEGHLDLTLVSAFKEFIIDNKINGDSVTEAA